MKRVVLSVLIFLAACASQEEKQSPMFETIMVTDQVVDGVPVKPQKFKGNGVKLPEWLIEKVACGDAKTYSAARDAANSKLRDAWDKVVGKESAIKCQIKIDLDPEGKILGYKEVDCGRPLLIRKVFKEVVYLPLPENKCMADKIRGATWRLDAPGSIF